LAGKKPALQKSYFCFDHVNGYKCLSQGYSNVLPHRESNQRFTIFRLLAQRLYQLSDAAASFGSIYTLRTLIGLKSNNNWT